MVFIISRKTKTWQYAGFTARRNLLHLWWWSLHQILWLSKF